MNDERQKHKKLNKNTPLFITLIQSASILRRSLFDGGGKKLPPLHEM
jgi:hypothetical protein